MSAELALQGSLKLPETITPERADMPQTESHPAIDSSERDLAALQGVWQQIGFEANGVVDPPDDVGEPGALTTFRGNQFEVHSTSGKMLLHGRFQLDATTTPKAITWIDAVGHDKDQPLPASYRLDGDRFVFIAADSGMAQPTDFVTTQGLTMRRFIRHTAG